MKLTKESVLKTFNSLTMPAWIKRVITLIIDYVDETASSIDSKADLVGGKVPAEQLPSYVDDVINFWDITTGVNPISTIINNVNYTNRMWFITKSTSSESIGIKYPNKFIDFGANTSEDDWTIIEPEEGKIYIKIGPGDDKNHSFRWSGIDLIDLDKNWNEQINNLVIKTYTIDLGVLIDLLDLSESTKTSVFANLYEYVGKRNRFQLINLRWRYNSADYSSPIIDADSIERTFRIYNQGYLQTYKILKEDDNYSLVRVSNIPEFVSLDYSQINVALSDDLIERLKNAAGVIINDDTTYPNVLTAYISSWKSDDYLVFTKNNNVSSAETFIFLKSLSVDLNTKRANFNSKRYTLPYGAYSQFGFTGKNADAVNQEVARLVNMNSCYITSSDLNKVHSGDKLENIKNATFLILDEGSGKTKIFTRGYSSDTTIYYNCLESNVSTSYTTLELPSNLLKSIRNSQLDDVIFNNYNANGGTKINKKSMYKELVAQFTENTYVLDSSKLNTVLTNEEASSVQNATTLIVTNVVTENNILVFNRGALKGNSLNFFNMESCIDGSITMNRIIFDVNVKKCSNIRVVYGDPATYYIGKGGKNNAAVFNKSFLTLYNNLYVIDSSLLNTTIADTSIQDSIKRANILVIEDSTDSSYKVCIKGYVTSNIIYFFNLQNANADYIVTIRVQFNITTNLLSSNDVYLQSAFNAYKLGGGTKYTTESAFNAQFAKVIDMTVTQ